MMRPSRAHASSLLSDGAASRGVVTTNNAPLARRLPFRADANSEGRCRRAVAGKVAFMAAQSPAIVNGKPARGAAGLDGEALAALCATCVDHGTTATGFHADTETVGALAAGNGWLECAFHGKSKVKELQVAAVRRNGTLAKGTERLRISCLARHFIKFLVVSQMLSTSTRAKRRPGCG